MNICIPVDADEGLDSNVCAHFGSAPCFLIVDPDTGDSRSIVNTNQHHGHGGCAPLQSLQGESLDGMVVGGIGRGALNKLAAARIPVYFAQHGTVREILAALRAGSLRPMEPENACAHHGQSHA